MNVLILDFDGTLTRFDTFPLFLRFATGGTFWRRLPRVIWQVLRFKLGLTTAQEAKERILALYLAGWTRKRLEETGERFMADLLRDEEVFQPGALELIRRARQEGRVLLVSASAEEWVLPFARAMGIEALATRLEYANDGGEERFTGRILGANCHGPEKVRRLREVLPDLDKCRVTACGDSPGDREMLALAGRSFWKRLPSPEEIWS